MSQAERRGGTSSRLGESVSRFLNRAIESRPRCNLLPDEIRVDIRRRLGLSLGLGSVRDSVCSGLSVRPEGADGRRARSRH
jgi:hypothetical protein